MNKTKRVWLLAICLAALWVFMSASGVLAQGKSKKKNQDKKQKNKSEQVTEQEKGKKQKDTGKEQGSDKQNMKKAAKKEYGDETGATGEPGKTRAKAKYKPKHMNDTDMKEWTDGNPPGWTRGKKTGWGGAGAPPGQMKKGGQQVRDRERDQIHIYPPQAGEWDQKKKQEWDDKLEQSRTRILGRIQTKGDVPEGVEESAIVSLEGAAGSGVPIEATESVIDRAVVKRMRGEEIEQVTRAMSYGADKNTDYGKLRNFVNRRIDAGETGDNIAVSVYREIDEGTMVKKKPWYKRLFSR